MYNKKILIVLMVFTVSFSLQSYSWITTNYLIHFVTLLLSNQILLFYLFVLINH